MYHYIYDKEFLKRMRRVCSDLINQLVQRINNDSFITVEAHLVGSGARNLITQNAVEPVDLDYNLCVHSSFLFSEHELKEYIRKQFNIILQKNGWGDCEDSTAVLSTEHRQFTKGNSTSFKIDVAIVTERSGRWYRLIHQKTGLVEFDRYFWNEIPHSKQLWEKVDTLKEKHLWNEVRDLYLEKKNMYLRRQTNDHPSFNVYTETVNEVYTQHFTNRVNDLCVIRL